MPAEKDNVLVIITGGTICMLNPCPNSPLRPASLAERLKIIPELQDESLPNFDVLEWEHLVDSSDVSLPHWTRMAEEVEEHYHKYDGFVILHGTDTLAYSASVLSFMLENLNKPVILTGSMLPMAHVQTDARRNLAVALLVAASTQIKEVCILFGSKLIRGNRARKLDCSQMDAFDSPNFPNLGTVGVDTTINDSLLLAPSNRRFRIYKNFNLNVVVVSITPGFHPKILFQLFESPGPLGVVLQLYGSGTAPAGNREFLEAIKFGIERDAQIVAVSQCPKGTCSLRTYENGAYLYDLGVIEGKDMTAEAAFAKLAYLLGKGYRCEGLRQLMEANIRGEVTEAPSKILGQAALHHSAIPEVADLANGDAIQESPASGRTRRSRSEGHKLPPLLMQQSRGNIDQLHGDGRASPSPSIHSEAERKCSRGSDKTTTTVDTRASQLLEQKGRGSFGEAASDADDESSSTGASPTTTSDVEWDARHAKSSKPPLKSSVMPPHITPLRVTLPQLQFPEVAVGVEHERPHRIDKHVEIPSARGKPKHDNIWGNWSG